MDVPAIVAIIGGIAFLVGLLGGGIEAVQVKIPQLPRWLRFLSGLMGVVLIGIAIWLSFATSAPQTLATTPTRPSPVQQVTPEPSTRTDVPSTRRLLTGPEIDAALGAGNWECFPDRLDGVALIDVPSDFVITDPIAEVDKQGVKYTRDQMVPSGGNATAWLNGELSDRQQCPSQGQAATLTPTSSQPCAFVTRSQIEELKRIQDVAAAIKRAEEFAGYRQNDLGHGETIPAGVLIAIDLRSSDLEQFGVTPVNNQGGWGLFETTREVQAPNTCAYWCIQKSSNEKCEWLEENFPQTLEEMRSSFNLPADSRNFGLVYEGCGPIATGFVFEGDTEFELQVPEGGCIDSYVGAFFSEPPVDNGGGGLRAHSGTVRATGVTYRAFCPKRP